MSLVGIGLNLLLVVLLGAALALGIRLNARLKALKAGQESFARAVVELGAAAQRAEQGLSDLRAASAEASDILIDRIERARTLAQRLERLTDNAPAALAAVSEPAVERRLGALISAAHQPRSRAAPERAPPRPARSDELVLRARPTLPEDELFEEAPRRGTAAGGRR